MNRPQIPGPGDLGPSSPPQLPYDGETWQCDECSVWFGDCEAEPALVVYERSGARLRYCLECAVRCDECDGDGQYEYHGQYGEGDHPVVCGTCEGTGRLPNPVMMCRICDGFGTHGPGCQHYRAGGVA